MQKPATRYEKAPLHRPSGSILISTGPWYPISRKKKACRKQAFSLNLDYAETNSAAVWLFLFLVVDSVFAEPRRILLQFQLLATRFTPYRVVVVACFFANEIHHFQFSLFAFGHRADS
jgi:hypothetical protein